MLHLWRHLARNLHTSHPQWQMNYYEALGIAKRSTQNEIKAAYYKLSMAYHPDRNKGCESSAKKFREITQAYEVLGNYRLRRLYDKGIVQRPGAPFAQDIPDMEPEVSEDDPQTKFYKSRFKKSKVSDAEGRTPIYDFDEWSRAHYGKNFDRRQAAQVKYDHLQRQKEISRISGQNDLIMFAFLFAGFAVYLLYIAEASYDTPKETAAERAKKEENPVTTPKTTE